MVRRPRQAVLVATIATLAFGCGAMGIAMPSVSARAATSRTSPPFLPGLSLNHSFTTAPFAGTSTSARDEEGSTYVPSDNALWLTDDNAGRAYEVDATTQQLRRTIPHTAFLNALPVGGGAPAGTLRADDLESISYDPVHDVLYVTSGNCCGTAPYFPTVYRLTRDVNGAFQVEAYQPLPEGTDPTGMDWKPGIGLFMAHNVSLWTYDWATNALGAPFNISGVGTSIVGIDFTDDGLHMWVTTKLNHMFRVDTTTSAAEAGYAFPLAQYGILDPRDVELINNQLFVSDGYDFRPPGDPLTYAIFVFDVVDLNNVPGAPTNVVATGHEGAASVAFSAPPAHSSPIASYTVVTSPGNIYTSASASPITVSGLTDGVTYTVSVFATNASGHGPFSAVSSAITPPGAPFNAGHTPTIDGNYKPIAGDFNGDGRADVLWYQAGPAIDRLWRGGTNGTFTATNISISGDYTPIPGDFNGDGKTDIFWYGPGTNSDAFWNGTNSGFANVTVAAVNGTYTPVVGDFNGDGVDDIFWYGPGTAHDAFWLGTAFGFQHAPTVVANAVATPIAGDFNGDGMTDIFWYAPGAAPDSLWQGATIGFTAGPAVQVNGTYVPIAGDFNGDGKTDIVWYAPGSGADALWRGALNGFGAHQQLKIDGTFTPVSGDFNGDGRGDILWFAPAGPDQLALGG